jgi:hypothetical protein
MWVASAKIEVTLGLTVSHSVCLGIEPHDQMFVPASLFLFCLCGAPSLTRGRLCRLSVTVCSRKPVITMDLIMHFTRTINMLHGISIVMYARPLSVQAQCSTLCPIESSSRYKGSLVIRTVVFRTAVQLKPFIFPMSCG